MEALSRMMSAVVTEVLFLVCQWGLGMMIHYLSLIFFLQTITLFSAGLHRIIFDI
jgi:hypothetical protein